MVYVVWMRQGNIVLRNISGVTKGVFRMRLHRCPLRKVALFIGIRKWYFLLTNFNFWPATEKSYGVFILTGCQKNYNELFKEHICSIGMSYAVVWFRRVHLQKQPSEMFFKKLVLKNSAKFTENNCAWVFFMLFFFLVPCGEIWLGWIHHVNSVGCLL